MSADHTIRQLLEARAETHAAFTAIQGVSGQMLTYAQLHDVVTARTRELSGAGVGHGDVVAVALPNGPEMAVTFLSVSCCAAVAPLNPRLTKAEFLFYLRDLDVRVVVVEEEDSTHCSAAALELGIPILRTVMPRDYAIAGLTIQGPPPSDVRSLSSPTSEDVALYLHTSGTTSRPKMVPLSHENLCRSAANVAGVLRLTPEDLCLNVMPLFHIHGLVAALLASLHAGAGITCTPGFVAPSFFDWFKEVQPSWYTAVPTMHQSVRSRATDGDRAMVAASPLRFIRSSSASLAPSVLAQLEEMFSVPVIEAYGMTEAAHQMTSNPLPPGKRKPGSVGVAAGPEVDIFDEKGQRLVRGNVGEVCIRGPNVTAGYRGVDLTGVFHTDGWFRTGDQGYLDGDGYLFLTGRLKEIINRGGETIAPREIDEALLDHPDVKQAVAFSVPDESLGEEVAAAVVLEAGSQLDEQTLQNFLAVRLSFPKLPKRLVFLEDIPKGPTGKLQRIGLAERLGITSVRPAAHEAAEQSAASLTTTADSITRIWGEVLRRDDIGLDEDFLDVGGDSITASQLVVRIREAFDLDIPLLAFFNAATIRNQSTLIDRLLKDDDDVASE